jgi:DNA-binding response OmpR family regulator
MKLLIVEDNPDLVANLYDFLEARGHVLDAAYDGPSGLRLALKGNYDAIVLDLMLPGMDGLDVCRQLRAEGSRTPVLMLTARDTLEDKLQGFATGTDDYLVKPFALQELTARLSALVRRSRGEVGSGILRVSDLVFDPAVHRVRRGSRNIELPPTALTILRLLMHESPRVVKREEIEREVWGEHPPDSDALRTHMHLLRTAVDGPGEPSLLRTVRSVGYQLVEPDALSA